MTKLAENIHTKGTIEPNEVL